jgi:hypothetical protein
MKEKFQTGSRKVLKDDYSVVFYVCNDGEKTCARILSRLKPRVLAETLGYWLTPYVNLL